MKRNLLILSLIFLVSASNYSLSNTIISTSSSEIIVENEEGEKEKDPEEKKKKDKKKNDSRLDGRIVGLKIGGGPANITDLTNFQKHKGGFYVGLYREFLFAKVLGVSVEGSYWLTGFTNDTTLVKTSYNYINVPVQLNLNLGKFYVAAGMYAGLNVRSSEQDPSSDTKTYFGFQNNRYQLFDWGAVFNIGFKWRFLGFDVRYVLGLQDTHKEMPGNQYNSALFFGASMHLMKRKKKKN